MVAERRLRIFNVSISAVGLYKHRILRKPPTVANASTNLPRSIAEQISADILKGTVNKEARVCYDVRSTVEI